MTSSQPESTAERFLEENQQAEQHITNNDLPAAAAILVSIVERDPENWRAYNNMGIISWMQSAWSDAFTMFRRAAELKGDYLDALMNLFDAGLKLRRVGEALPLFRRALEINPDLEEIKIIAEGIEEQGDEIYQSERALQVGQYHEGIESANKLLEDGRINEAMTQYLDIVSNEGPNADAFCGLGIISYYQKRYEDAYSLFIESIKLNPVNTDTFLNMLDAARMIGRVAEAKKIYTTYAETISSLKRVRDEFEKE
jgi:tetratricopeptide (TPR) repeat protein